jgi:hypothetical protein
VAFPLGIIRETVEAGARSRASFDRSLRDAPGAWSRGLVVDALEKITGLDVSIEGTMRLYPDGVVIQRLKVGDGMTVEKLLVRAQLQPLLEVLDSWKQNPGNVKELRIDAIRARGVVVKHMDFEGVRRAFNLYVRAPGPIVVAKLLLYDLTLDIDAHRRYEGMSKSERCVPETLTLSSFEMAALDSRMPASAMAGCVARVEENGPSETRLFVKDTERRASGGSASTASTASPETAARDPFAAARAFVPKEAMARIERLVTPEMVGLANASAAIFESLAPLAAADVGLLLERSGSAQLAELGRVGGTGEALLDAGVVAALLASGFPRRILADGGKVAVKLVESGVGSMLALECADTLKVLIEKRMIDRVLDLDLMDALLDRPDLTKAMFKSGVVKGVLSNGVLAALLRSGKERVCVSLLRGPMIETLMNTGLLPAMMTFEVPGDERLPPPTGSVDENADDAKLGDAVPW